MKKLLVVLAVLAGIIFSGCVGDGDMATHITTLEQLQAMKDDLAADYILDNDINAAATSSWNGGLGFEPVGVLGDRFEGSFDGQGYTISNLFIDRPSTHGVGLFGYVGANIPIGNVRLDDCDITGLDSTGALIGINGDSGIFSKLGSTGSVVGNNAVGGIIGQTGEQCSISECFSKCSAEGNLYVGGLVGLGDEGLNQSNSYARGNVTGSSNFVGGLIGALVEKIQYDSAVDKCYSTGAVSCAGDYTGGLIGYRGGHPITNSFWDTETSGQETSDGGTGKTTAEMKTKSTFTDAGWDFDNIWSICEAPYVKTYPWLQWEAFECEENQGTEMKVYVCDSENDRIVVLDMDLGWLGSFAVTDPDPYSIPWAVTVDKEFIWVAMGLQGNDVVRKYKISDYSLVDSVEVYGPWDLDQNDDYVYLVEKRQIDSQYYRYVTKIRKSDLSVSRFESFPVSSVNRDTKGIAVDDDYIYVSGSQSDTGVRTIRKFNKETEEMVTENQSVGDCQEMGQDDTYLYCTNDDGEIRIFKKSDLSLYKVISDLCENAMDAAAAGGYVYVVDGGWDPEVKGQQVLKVNVSTEEVVATFGEAGYQGSDSSHLKWPHGIAIGEIEKEAPWDEDIIEPTGEVKVEIPRRSGEWTALEDVMRIHTSNGKDTSSPRAPVEIGQAELLCCNISKNFNSFEAASVWYKNLEGYATQVSLGCSIGGSPISKRLFTGIIKAVHAHRLSQTAEITVVDFLDYFGRVTIKETPVWESISLTQLFKNLVELAFPEWTEGTDYFVEDLGGSTIPAIGYTDLNLLSELKMIAESRGKRIYTDAYGRLHCASRNPERDPLTVSYNYNLEDVKERRDMNSILNWIVVHATPYEIKPDLEPPGKLSGFTATPGDTKIDLSWSNPTDDDFEKVLIRFSTTAYPLNIEDGTQIYEGTGESKEHTGLTNGQKYYYSAWTVDDKDNWSEAAHAAATPASAVPDRETWPDETGPSKITQFTATPEHSKIILTWYNPTIANFDKVVIRRSTTSYPPTSASGSAEYDGTAETHEDTGLINGTRYYYSAFAKNTDGDYSGAAFASAIPAGLRKVLSTKIISGGKYAGPGGVGTYFSDYSKKVRLSFATGGRTEGWLKFRHRWDVQTTSGPKYPSNQGHEVGLADDLSLSFGKSLGIASITVRRVSYSAKVLVVDYTFTLTTRVLKVKFYNKLSLMG